MMQDSPSTAAPSPQLSSAQEADLPLATAVRDLFSGLRAGAVDVVDLIAAEAHVAMRLLVALVVSALGAVVLAVFGLAGVATAIAAELIARGMSASTAIAVLGLLFVAGSLSLAFRVRGLSRRILFGHSRSYLRGEQ